jgi:hypothetical protein
MLNLVICKVTARLRKLIIKGTLLGGYLSGHVLASTGGSFLKTLIPLMLLAVLQRCSFVAIFP